MLQNVVDLWLKIKKKKKRCQDGIGCRQGPQDLLWRVLNTGLKGDWSHRLMHPNTPRCWQPSFIMFRRSFGWETANRGCQWIYHVGYLSTLEVASGVQQPFEIWPWYWTSCCTGRLPGTKWYFQWAHMYIHLWNVDLWTLQRNYLFWMPAEVAGPLFMIPKLNHVWISHEFSTKVEQL